MPCWLELQLAASIYDDILTRKRKGNRLHSLQLAVKKGPSESNVADLCHASAESPRRRGWGGCDLVPSLRPGWAGWPWLDLALQSELEGRFGCWNPSHNVKTCETVCADNEETEAVCLKFWNWGLRIRAPLRWQIQGGQGDTWRHVGVDCPPGSLKQFRMR